MKNVLNYITLGLLVFVMAGCGKSQVATDLSALNKTGIDRIRNAYTLYMEDHGFRGPKNEKEFRAYLTSDDRGVQLKLDRMGIDRENIDKLFINDRDNEPFVIRYGLKGVADHAIAFEKTGVEGKRLVALGTQIECDDDEYEAWLSGKNKPQKPGSLEEPEPVIEE
jgi:hypothetical protein